MSNFKQETKKKNRNRLRNFYISIRGHWMLDLPFPASEYFVSHEHTGETIIAMHLATKGLTNHVMKECIIMLQEAALTREHPERFLMVDESPMILNWKFVTSCKYHLTPEANRNSTIVKCRLATLPK